MPRVRKSHETKMMVQALIVISVLWVLVFAFGSTRAQSTSVNALTTEDHLNALATCTPLPHTSVQAQAQHYSSITLTQGNCNGGCAPEEVVFASNNQVRHQVGDILSNKVTTKVESLSSDNFQRLASLMVHFREANVPPSPRYILDGPSLKVSTKGAGSTTWFADWQEHNSPALIALVGCLEKERATSFSN